MTEDRRVECRKWRILAIEKENFRIVKNCQSGCSFNSTITTLFDTENSIENEPSVDSKIKKDSESIKIDIFSSSLNQTELFTRKSEKSKFVFTRLYPVLRIHRQTSMDDSKASSKNISLVIADNLNKILKGELFEDEETASEQLKKVQEMKSLLSEYHNLQFEELKFRQQEESQRLNEQEQKIRHLLQKPEISSGILIDSKSSTICEDVSSLATITPIPFDVNSGPFANLTSLIRGYLTRKLYRCYRLEWLRKTAKDLNVQLNIPTNSGISENKNEEFREILKRQLYSIKCEIWDIFFLTSLLKQSELRNFLPKGSHLKQLSYATKQRIARKTEKVPFSLPKKSAKSPLKLTLSRSNRRSLLHLPRRVTSVHSEIPKISSANTTFISIPLKKQQTSATNAHLRRKTEQKSSNLKRPWR